MASDSSPTNLALAILRNSSPDVATELVHLTLGSEDPDDHRRYLELVNKLEGKDGANMGITMNVTFDFSGAGVQVATAPLQDAEVIEADDLRPVITLPEPAPELENPFPEFDMAKLLGESA